MTLAWAIIIVAVLFLLDKYHMLKKSLIVAAIVAVALVVIVMGYFGWHYLDTQWAKHENKVRSAKENALFAQKNECLNLYTGKVHPVNEPGSQIEGQPAALGPNDTPGNNVPSDLREVGKVPIPQGAVIGGDGWTSIPPGGLTQAADEHWCNSNEVIHERGTPIDQWAILGETPTVPPGRYHVVDGEKDSDGRFATPARLCVDAIGTQRCYTSMVKGHIYGNSGRAEEVKLSGGGKLLLFTADDYDGVGNTSSTTVALLANRGGQLSNLLPEIITSDEYRLWNLPEFSPMPVFVNAYYFWDMSDRDECHACPHRVHIASYVYNKETESYAQYDEFMTPTKHLWPPYEKSVLDSEKAEILTRFKKAAADEAARHIIVK
jgi:hypothetical protein